MKVPERIGAFFDLDGTLLASPSLEWRFIRYLAKRDEIGARSAIRWLRQFAARMVAGDVHGATYGNKCYLAGVPESAVENWAEMVAQDVRHLFGAGRDTVRWHIERGHQIVLISGTLAPLAQKIAGHLPGEVDVHATEVEVKAGCFTGRVLGPHVAGTEKARIVRTAAVRWGLDLAQSHAYGNETADVPMLESVGSPVAVNPSWWLRRTAGIRGWPIESWEEGGGMKAIRKVEFTGAL